MVNMYAIPPSSNDTGLVQSRPSAGAPGERPQGGPFLPQGGTSSSADEVCSSVDGFFFPRLMILVIFFPVTLETVPLPSDLELFFLFTVKNNDNRKNVQF